MTPEERRDHWVQFASDYLASNNIEEDHIQPLVSLAVRFGAGLAQILRFHKRSGGSLEETERQLEGQV